MRLERNFVTLPEAQNRPALGGAVVDPARYVGRIIDGFAATYRLLLAHRDELVASSGPIRSFADAPIRVVLRPTRQYALILSESYHPDVLRDALDRDLLLDRLWVAIPARPELERVVGYEHADLVAGDVPLFTSRPDSRDLFTTHGARVEGYFAESGLDAALARVASLSEDDLQRQQWVVRASLVALSPARHSAGDRATQRARSANTVRGQMPSADACIGAAHAVARRLAELALRRGNRATWLGLTLAMDRDWVVQPVGSDLYGGTLGIAQFLAYAGEITGDAGHTVLAQDVIAQTASLLSPLTSESVPGALSAAGSIGAFGLLGGATYVLAHVGALWGDDTLVDLAERVAISARPAIAEDVQADVIGGSAGFVIALNALRTMRPDGVAREIMRECAERLIASATDVEGGIAWTTKLESTRPLTGH
jgi:type 2 lantibiotic biosynthesis protein LanM